jgi:hypothetical protein
MPIAVTDATDAGTAPTADLREALAEHAGAGGRDEEER